jgi:hypothetical protein
MARGSKTTIPILLDLHYKYSMNHFEEFFGDSVNYSEIEQSSYIDLKEMAFEKISRSIKFRKFGRHRNILTVKMDLSQSEYESFLKIFREEEIDEEASKRAGKTKYIRFNFIHDFTISNIRDLTDEEKVKFKKTTEPDDDSDDSDDSDEEIGDDTIDEIEFVDEFEEDDFDDEDED